jgi:hypothetical protein
MQERKSIKVKMYVFTRLWSARYLGRVFFWEKIRENNLRWDYSQLTFIAI